VGWIFDYYKQQFETGKQQGKELKKKHKHRIKKLFGRKDKNEKE